MKKLLLVMAMGTLLAESHIAFAQEPDDSVKAPVEISLEDALQIALSENVSVKIADMEIEKTGYAKKGTYSSLYPQINATSSFQRTIKRQRMYMDVPGMEDGMEVGRMNTWSAGVSASMPVVNAQLWQMLKISDMDVELSVEKARSSRLAMVNQVKQAYYAVLLAKEAFNVYRSVYDNAVANYERTEQKYNAQRASELDMARAKASVANAVPNACDSESAIIIALWQLKAVLGVDLESNIDVKGSLSDYESEMTEFLPDAGSLTLDNNSQLRQLSIQAQELAAMVKAQQYAYIPSLSLSFSYSINAMENGFNFNQYHWSPYAFAGMSLSIPIFSGHKRLNDVRQAKVNAAELNMQMADTERQLKISIQQNLNKMETAVKSLSSARIAEEAARKAYGITAKSYEVGRSTFTDLNDAQLVLTQSQLGVCQAIFSYLSAKASLENTVGADFTDFSK